MTCREIYSKKEKVGLDRIREYLNFEIETPNKSAEYQEGWQDCVIHLIGVTGLEWQKELKLIASITQEGK